MSRDFVVTNLCMLDPGCDRRGHSLHCQEVNAERSKTLTRVERQRRLTQIEAEKLGVSVPTYDALAFLDKTIDNVEDIPESPWRSDEVVAMLRELRGYLVSSGTQADEPRVLPEGVDQ